jgi:hypothetical protein
VDANIKSASSGRLDLAKCRSAVTANSRIALGNAAKANSKSKKASWFKSLTAMETVGRSIVGPDLMKADAGFRALLHQLFTWISDAE